MIAMVAQWIGIGLAAWLVGLGVWMLLKPASALVALGKMGSTSVIHFGEMTLRIAAGMALVLAAPVSLFPTGMLVIGGFLIASGLILMALPRRWHAAYSTWWAAHIPKPAVRVIGPVSVAMGAALAWSLGLAAELVQPAVQVST